MSSSSTKIWQPRQTINESFTSLVDQYPDKEIFVFYNNGKRDPYTATTLYTLAGRFADRLRRYGFQKQDIIANTLPNCPERVVTDLGIILAGCVPMNKTHLLSDGRDLYHAARKSKCKCIIMSNSDQSPTWNLLQSKLCGKDSSDFVSDISVEMAPDLKSAILVSRNNTGSRKPLLEDLRTCNEEVFVNTCCPDDNVVVFNTSGSTGFSKLVPKTHREIMDNSIKNDFSPFGEHELLDLDLVLYTDLMIVTRVLKDDYDLDHTSACKDFWEAAAKEKCALALMVPLEANKHLGYAKRVDGLIPHSCSKGVIDETTTHYLSVELVHVDPPYFQPATRHTLPNQAKKFFHLADTVIICYGSTECLGISKTYADGGFNGYLNKLEDPDPDTLKAFTQDGWLNTEDFGYIDDAGNLFVLGRNKDVINYGCVIVYPYWLEEMITEHPDVLQACVVPVSDPVLNQNICACIKISAGSTSGAEDIRRYCEKMFLANLPDEITPRPGFYMFFNEDFPELSYGKLDKVKLKNLAEEKFGYKGQT
ncbi:hypothetical protein Btru_009279 [Bulinus truncatus]|nr:hypothetical protein Btru_009279 [Bulinus truncatus]